MGHSVFTSRVRVVILPLLFFSLLEFFILHNITWFLQSSNRVIPYFALTKRSIVGLIGAYSLFLSISRLLSNTKQGQNGKKAFILIIQVAVFSLGILWVCQESYYSIENGNYYHIDGLLSKILPFLSLLNNIVANCIELVKIYNNTSFDEDKRTA